MKLLIDMGNTRLKWAVWQDAQLVRQEALLNEQINETSLYRLWQTFSPTQVVISCVSANQLLACVNTVIANLWADANIIHARAVAQGFGVNNGYVEPEKLGVDRWLALIAAHNLYNHSVCIVDCGTAITIDLLTAEGMHLGGFISAGIGLMKQALARNTHALPFAACDYPLQAASFTEAAIHSGTVLAAVGLIEQVLVRYQGFAVLLTGGDAPLIAPLLSVSSVLDSDLVLRGLAIVAMD